MRPVTVIGLDVENPVTSVNAPLPGGVLYPIVYDIIVDPPLSVGAVNATDMELLELV